jgi:hypothetical protein
VKVNSDSIMATIVREPDLFTQIVDVPENAIEQWVIPYVIDPLTRSFYEAWVGRVVGLEGRAPYRLLLDDLAPVPLDAPLPPRFTGGRADDLELDDDGEQDAGEQAG